MMKATRVAVWRLALVGSSLAVVHCGGDEPANGDTPSTTTIPTSLADPCDAEAPVPNDFFLNEDGTSEQAECPLPSDPGRAALVQLRRSDGPPVNLDLDGATPPNDRGIRLPLGAAATAASLVSTATISLDGGGDPNGELPPVLLFAQTGTTAADFEQIPITARLEGGEVLVRTQGGMDLRFSQRYVVVATAAILDTQDPPQPFAASPQMEWIMGARDESDLSGGIESAEVPRLRRAKERLAPVLQVLDQATPRLTPDRIVSIHGFRTEPGPERLNALADRYFELFEAGRIPFGIRGLERSIPAREINPEPGSTAGIGSFNQGRILVPRFLNDAGRIDPNWGEGGVQSREVWFTLSEPMGNTSELILYVPGFGRGASDLMTAFPVAGAFGSANMAVFAIDLQCHGARSPDAMGRCATGRTRGELADLADQEQNNGLVQITGGDFVPDSSGVGYLPGDAGRLRDAQIAQALELLHVYVMLRNRRDILNDEGFDYVVNRLTLLPQGHAAPPAVAALAAYARGGFDFGPFRNAIFVNAGAGYEDLVTDGFEALRDSFLATAPEGVTVDTLGAYLSTIESEVLQALDVEVNAPIAAELFRNSQNRIEGLNFFRPEFPTNVPLTAQRRLSDAFGREGVDIQTFGASCDDFFVYPCEANEDAATNEAQSAAVVAADS